MSKQERCPTGWVTIRNKVTEKQAIQWTGENIEAVKQFMGVVAINFGKVVVSTLEGDMKADVGDWIIKGLRGEFYPCKPDIFEKSYEIVSGKDSAPGGVAEQPVPSGKQDEREREIPHCEAHDRRWLVSAETGEPLYCDMCDLTDQLRDMQTERDAKRKRVQELQEHEDAEAAFMAKRGVLYNCTFIDGWSKVLDERDELKQRVQELEGALPRPRF